MSLPAGRVSGGESITLTGAFTGLMSVTIGGNNASLTANSASQITFTTPAHAVGAVDIVLTPTSGSPYTKTNAFAYLPTVFSDDTLTAGTTTAKAQHILELRQPVDALRAVAGLASAPWTDSTLTPTSTLIKAVHITELRSNLESAAMLLGYGSVSYTDPTLSGLAIKQIHIEELRQRIRNIATLATLPALAVHAGADQVIALPQMAQLMGATTGGSGAVSFAWSKLSGPDSILFSSASAAGTTATFSVSGVYVLRLTAMDAQTTATDDVQVTVNADPTPPPPDPATVAPTPDQSQTGTIGVATEFLYTGPNPIQTGVAPGTIKAERVVVLRGRVLNKSNTPLSNVKITILDHPEFGQTLSRADGMFDMAVNGGGVLVVKYEKAGLLPVQRAENVPWQEYAVIPDVVLMGYDPNVTLIDLNLSTPVQVAQGGAMNDSSGMRRARLFFMQGTTAQMKLSGGGMQSLSKLHVRATEYTVGTNGPNAMPGDLPPNSAYTYALEYSVDEAVAAGATDVVFNHAVISYEENFLSFPTGSIVPTGYYDRTSGRWLPSLSGRVVKILSISSGQANLDLDGSNTAASNAAYAALGITVPERQQLATLYTMGQSLWRTPLTHFSPWDKNKPWSPPEDATRPNVDLPTGMEDGPAPDDPG